MLNDSKQQKKQSVERAEDRGLESFPKFEVRPSARIGKKDAELLLSAFESIRERCGDEMPPEELVAFSAPETSPTHHLFPWDDAKAAHLYRLDLARKYLGYFYVVFEPGGKPVRAFPNLKIGQKRRYVTIAKVLSSKELTEVLIKDALTQLEGWTRRYEALRDVAELKPIFRHVQKLSAKLRAKGRR